MTTERPAVAHRHLGRIRYGEALALQNDTWQAIVDGTGQEVLFTLEHDPVVSIGKRGDDGDVLVPTALLEARGVDVVHVDRGGEVTYHGPGQLVFYGIVNIGARGIGVGDWVRGVADAIREELVLEGVEAAYDGDNPGLWTAEGAKVCAVGMRISKGVARHGAAVNLTTDLDAFQWIVPCGLPQSKATSVMQLTGAAPSLESFADRIIAGIRERFDLTAPPA